MSNSSQCAIHLVPPELLEGFVEALLSDELPSNKIFFTVSFLKVALGSRVRTSDDDREDRLKRSFAHIVSREAPYVRVPTAILTCWDGVGTPESEWNDFEGFARALAPVFDAFPELIRWKDERLTEQGNFGRYIPPSQVANALSDFEQHLQGHLEKHEMARVIRHALRTAVERGCGYWETAGLALAENEDPTLELWKSEAPALDSVHLNMTLGRFAAVFANAAVIASASDGWTATVDFSRPGFPVERLCDKPVDGVAIGDRQMLVETTSQGKPSLATLDVVSGETQTLPLEVSKPTDIDTLRWLGNRLLIAPLPTLGARGQTPAWHEPGTGKLIPLDLPEPPGGWRRPPIRGGSGWTWGMFAAAKVGDSILVIWGGWLYRIDGEQTTLLEPSDLVHTGGGATLVPSSKGAYWLANDSLVHLGLDGTKLVFSDVRHAHQLVAGDAGALVLVLRDHPHAHTLHVVWPERKEMTSVGAPLLGDSVMPAGAAYIPGAKALAIIYGSPKQQTTELRLLPWKMIDDLPRTRMAATN